MINQLKILVKNQLRKTVKTQSQISEDEMSQESRVNKLFGYQKIFSTIYKFWTNSFGFLFVWHSNSAVFHIQTSHCGTPTVHSKPNLMMKFKTMEWSKPLLTLKFPLSVMSIGWQIESRVTAMDIQLVCCVLPWSQTNCTSLGVEGEVGHVHCASCSHA